MLFLLFMALASSQDGPKITTEAIAPGQWRMTITATDEHDPLRLATRLQPHAAEVCGDAGYYFGRYTFHLDQLAPGQGKAPDRADTLTLVQDVACGSRPPEPPPPPPAPVLGETDAKALNPRLESLSNAYFAALDEGRYAEAYAMISPEMIGGATLSDWTRSEKTQAATYGTVRDRRIGRLTWYSNPPDVPAGHYGAVDYVASRAEGEECGYLIWYRPTPDAAFVLSRRETTFLPHGLDRATRAAQRQAYCIIL